MVSLPDALFVLRPNAVPGVDYTLANSGSGDVIVSWTYATPQPTAGEIAAVTQDEVDAARLAKVRTAAHTGLLTRGDDFPIGVRAITRAMTTLINDRLQAAGQTRVLESEILAFINANPTIGDPI